MHLTILIVDDERNIRKTLAYCLEKDGHTVIAVGSIGDALIESSRCVFDVAFVDLRLGGEDGMELIPVMLEKYPWTKIVVITAYASIETAVEAMRRGATDYIPKPFAPDQIRILVGKIARLRQLEIELRSLRENIRNFEPEYSFDSRNPAVMKAVETARTAAGADAVILLSGESGTGKTILAHAIHAWSSRAADPFMAISCPTLPENLLESELFGHVRGAFTGALRDNPGRIAACEGGTLLLDEIGDLAPALQAKLLRFCQDKEYERVGDSTPRKADVRLIAATNADLAQRVTEGAFREDLYHRLNVISITLPPLRERAEDIMPIARTYLEFFAGTNHRAFKEFTPEAAELLKAYNWPGNLRELRNAVEHAVILGSGTCITAGNLPVGIRPRQKVPALGEAVSLAALEERHIRHILAATPALQDAAEILGIDKATLWRKRKDYGI